MEQKRDDHGPRHVEILHDRFRSEPMEHAGEFFKTVASGAHADGINDPDGPFALMFVRDEIGELEVAVEESCVSDPGDERTDGGSAAGEASLSDARVAQQSKRGWTFDVLEFERHDATAQIDAKRLNDVGRAKACESQTTSAALLALRLGETDADLAE